MTKSTVQTKVIYRGFVISIIADKKTNGIKSCMATVRHHVPEIKPGVSNRNNTTDIKTKKGIIECVNVGDSFGYSTVNQLEVHNRYKPDENSGFISNLLGWNDDPITLSTLVRETIKEVQSKIDTFIEEVSTNKIDKSEFKHGLEQTLSEPISEINIDNSAINTNSTYENITPCIDEISKNMSENI